MKRNWNYIRKAWRSVLIGTLLCVLFPLAASGQHGQIIYGWVYDAVTREVLADVKAELMDTTYAVLDTMRTDRRYGIQNRKCPWQFDIEGREAQPYIIRFSAEGYEEYEIRVPPVRFRPREWLHFVQDVYLFKELSRDLDEVTVKATKVQIYTRGDTVVYNADAFRTADGSMLDALIRQLPGVELTDDGRILVNGRYVENLMLNGEDFFKGQPEVMLQNLPAYTVKDVQVYEKAGRFSEFVGRKTGDEEYVMDIRLKKEYSVGWLGNAEAAYGTEDRYRARFFGLRFTTHTRISAFGNFNNMNENRKPGNNGDWSPSDLDGGLRTNKHVGADYMVNEKDGKYELNGNVSYLHYDTDVRTRTTGTDFLSGGDTYSRRSHEQAYCQTWLNTWHHILLRPGEKIQLQFTPQLQYGRWNDRNRYLSATFNEDPAKYIAEGLLDSIALPEAGDLMRRIAINRSNTDQNNRGDKLFTSMAFDLDTKPGIANDVLNVDVGVQYTNHTQRWYEHYRLDYPMGGGKTDYRNKYTNDDGPIRRLDFNAGASYWLWFPSNLALVPSYSYSRTTYNKRYELYRLDQLSGWGEDAEPALGMLPSESDHLRSTLDLSNSYWSGIDDQTHAPKFYLKWEGNPKRHPNAFWRVYATLLGHVLVQSLDYRRELIDTVVHRTTFLFKPSFQFNVQWGGKYYADVLYRMENGVPDMTSLIDIRTTSDPLNITLSNTGLKTSRTHIVNAWYEYRNKDTRRYYKFYGRYVATQDAMARGYIYNKDTGVRTWRAENVNGNYNAGGYVSCNLPLDKARRLTFNSHTTLYFYNSVDLIGAEDGTAPKRSTVHTLNSGEYLKLWYNFEKAQVGAVASCGWNRMTSRREDFTDINTFDFSYGVNAKVDLPWKLQFNTDLTLYARRGYSDSSMNTSELVWNANLSKRMCKDRLTIAVDGFDILGQLSNVVQTLNGQGRYETWRNVIPSYAMLRCIYRFDIKPAKQRGA